MNDRISRLFCSKEILNDLIQNNSLSQYLLLKEVFVMNGNIDNSKIMEENPYLKIYECYGNDVFPIISMNTADVKGKDLSGSRFFQRHNKQNTVGRLMPGVAVKVVDANNLSSELKEKQEGRLLIKGFGIEESIEDKSKIHNGWFVSNETGFIDSFGFLTIIKYK